MMNCPYLPKRSNFLILAISIASTSAYAVGPYQVYLENNELNISSGGSGTSYDEDIGIQDTGELDTVPDVPSTNGVGIPSFSFTIKQVVGATLPVSSGPYQFKVAVIIDDQDSDRQMEAYIGNLSLSVGPTGAIVGTIPSQNMKLYGQNGAGNLRVDASVNNASSNGPVRISGGKVTFDAVKLLDKLSANPLFANIILDEFDEEATYDFRIAVQQVGANSIQFGVNEGGFTAFPTNSNEPAFTLSSEAQAMVNPYSVYGSFNVVYIAPSTGGGGGGGGGDQVTETDNVDGADELEQEADDLLDALENLLEGAEIADSVLESINNAVESGAALAEDFLTQATTTSTAGALTAFTTINKSLTAAGNATEKGGTVDTAAAANTISNLATALAVVAGRTLTTAQVLEVNNIATSTLASATNLVTSGSTADILKVVQASSNILKQASLASGNAVSTAVATQVKELTTKAVDSVIKNLAPAATAGVDLTKPDQVKELMKSNPSVLEVALAASATLPANASIQIGGVSFTRDELVAQGIAAGIVVAISSPISGGFNFQAATTGYTVTTDSVTGNMTLTNGTSKYVAAAPLSRLVPDSIPNGINYLPNGTAILTGNGVATELAPTAFDSTGFSNAVSSAGFALTYRSNGTISIALANNERFSAAFAYDDLGAASSCGAISIVAPTGNPASASYAFTLKCANGPSQHVTPIADNAAFYTTVANAGLNASTNRNTGIVTINGVGSFKPSFFVTPLSVSDTTYYNANKNADGIAFRSKDANGDGKTDYEVLSANGIQVMYGQ